MHLPQIITLAVILATLITTGCSINKDIGEMRSSTQNMQKTLNEMNADMHDMKSSMRQTLHQTKEMKEGAQMSGLATHEMAAKTVSAFDLVQKGTLAKTRLDLLKAMSEAPDWESKDALARKYFRNFDFQVFQSESKDKEVERSHLFTSALTEFFEDVPRFIGRNAMDVQVLANAMGEIDGSQYEAQRQNHAFKAQSIFSLILAGLNTRFSEEKNPILSPEAARTVLKHEESALFLLEQRRNCFAMALVNRIEPDLSQIKTPDMITDTIELLDGITDIQLAFKQRDRNTSLDGALTTRFQKVDLTKPTPSLTKYPYSKIMINKLQVFIKSLS